MIFECIRIVDVEGGPKSSIVKKVNADDFAIKFGDTFDQPCALIIDKNVITLKYPKIETVDSSSRKLQNDITSFIKTAYEKFTIDFEHGKPTKVDVIPQPPPSPPPPKEPSIYEIYSDSSESRLDDEIKQKGTHFT
jgi:hypothetical protein